MTIPLLVTASCGGGDETGSAVSNGDAPATVAEAATSAMSDDSCATNRHLVVIDVFGAVAYGSDAFVDWVTTPTDPPEVRPGMAEVASAYRARGYELLYVTLAPDTVMVGETPLADAVTEWLQDEGLPTGDGTRVWTWDSQGDTPAVRVIDELVHLATEGVRIDAGYTNNGDKANALVTGGVPPDRLFTLDEAAGGVGSSGVPGNDLTTHLPAVEALEPVCRPG